MRRLIFFCGLFFLVFSVLPLLGQRASSSQPVLNVSSMDKSVDPCVDFYTYSCGGWMKKNPIPPDQVSWGIYSKLEDENKQVLHDILESAAKPDPARDTTHQKIGDFYAACMDTKAIDAAGLKPLQPYFEQIDALASKDGLAAVVAGVAFRNDYGGGPLFSVQSNQDFKDSTQVIAEIDQSGLGLPDRDYYFKDDAKSQELRKQYVAHVEKMLTLAGETPARAATDAQAVMRIETGLAKGSLTQVERRDPQALYHKMPVEQAEALSPAFQWQVFFAKAGLADVKSLNVTAPQFFQTMNEQLQKEDLASWKAYLRWHLLNSNARFLSTPFADENFAFYGRILRGAQEIEPRWKRCSGWADDDLGEALGKAYVEQTFTPQEKQDALKMVQEIKAAMDKDIQSLPWMTDATKKRAEEKLHAVADKIGYPDKWRDYSALTITRDDAVGNILRARAFEFHRQLNKIGKPVDRGEFGMTPPTVNAYYDPQKNDINFPAGILQPPLFSATSDAAPNYGDTGGTIGHELTHGFDDEGRQFDAQGNLRDWWEAADATQFQTRVDCISNQYGQYVVVDDLKINSKLTLGEDVADVGGLILAYMAWKEDTKGQKLMPIDGLTPEQRFFVGYGQSWCTNSRPEYERLRTLTNPHSPPRYRTNGVVSNMPEFQEAFHCKAGAPMVRENRCRVW